MKNIGGGGSKAAPANESNGGIEQVLPLTEERKPNSSSSGGSGIIGHLWWHFILLLNYYSSRCSWQLLLLRFNCGSNNNKRMRGGKSSISGRAILLLCIASFLAGSLVFTSSKDKDYSSTTTTTSGRARFMSGLNPPAGLTQSIGRRAISSIPSLNHQDVEKLNADHGDGSDHKQLLRKKLTERRAGDVMEEVRMTHEAIQSLDKTISNLEMELAATRTRKAAASNYSTSSRSTSLKLKKAFVVIGINTAFSSKKRRDSLRETWLPKGKELKKLEKEKGIVIRFVIGRSAAAGGGGGGVLDRAIDAENAEHSDFLRLNHVEGYHQLSTKTRLFFSTAVSIWDAHFYVKVDDDVHVNLGTLVNTLDRYKSQPRTYIGCMKSGPVLSQKEVKYHEPEFWKFGEEGNKYFRHATGQIYAISKDLALYISINSGILHRYANEDVSLGSWLIGLEVEHVDDRSMCCATPPDCEWKRQAGNTCIASFDWSCSGICNSVERMKHVHTACGEGIAS